MTWISVQDELPKDAKWVRAKNAEGEIFEKISYMEPPGSYWREFNPRGIDKIRRDITHWQPLPDLPELEK